MFSKIVISACILAVANAGLIAQPILHAGLVSGGYGHHHIEPAVAHTSEKVIRGPHNLQTLAVQSRTIVSPHSKSEVHIEQETNDIDLYGHHAAPITQHSASLTIADPIVHHAAPLAIASHTGYATVEHHGHGGLLGHGLGHGAGLLY